MRKYVAIILLIVALAVLGRFGYVKFAEKQSAAGKQASMIPVVTLDTVQTEEVADSIEASGRVSAEYSVDIVSKVQGTLLHKHFTEGDFVKKGQLLFTIDPIAYKIAVNQANAALQNARAVANRAQKDYERAKELVAGDFIAKSTYDSNLAEKNVAYANVRSASAQLSDAKRLLSYTQIKSPVDGRIGAVNITEGNYITMQTGPIARVVSVDPIYVSYSLDSKQFTNLRNDTIMPTVKQEEPIRVQVTLPNGKVYEQFGNQDFYGNEISQSTGAIQLRATFKNPDGILIPGDFVKVKVFSNTKHKEVVVPQAAVLQDSNGRYVYTVDEKGTAVQKYIVTSGESGVNFIVKEGLSEGDSFISDGVVKVMPGGKVKVVKKSDVAEVQDPAKAPVKAEDIAVNKKDNE